MNLLPFASTSFAPSPLSASVMRARDAPAMYSVVGWNCINSRSWRTAPARYAIAIPSPVAISGFVVSRYNLPAPPVARMVFCAQIICGLFLHWPIAPRHWFWSLVSKSSA